MIHDGLWDVYHQKPMGTCGDACASAFDITRRGTGRFRRAELHPGPQGDRRGDLPRRDRARRGRLRGARSTVVADDEGPSRFDEAKLRALKPAFGAADARRHHHGRERVEHQRRRGGRPAGLGCRARAVEARSARPDRRRRDAQPGARVVHHGAGLRHSQAARPRRLGRRPGRPLRDQRGVRRGRDGGRARAVDPGREAEYPRRRRGAGASDRLQRGADPGHAPARAQDGRGAAAAWPACASAAARRWPWRWRRLRLSRATNAWVVAHARRETPRPAPEGGGRT